MAKAVDWDAVQILIQNLEIIHNPKAGGAEKLLCRAIEGLTTTAERSKNRQRLLEMQVAPPVTALINISDSPLVHKVGALLLLNLTKSDDLLAAFSHERGIRAITRMMKSEDFVTQERAVLLASRAATISHNHEFLGAQESVSLLLQHTNSPRSVIYEPAVLALAALSTNSECCAEIVRCGGTSNLLNNLQPGAKSSPKLRSGSLKVVVNMVRVGGLAAQQTAMDALRLLMVSDTFKTEFIRAGGIDAVKQVLEVDGTDELLMAQACAALRTLSLVPVMGKLIVKHQLLAPLVKRVASSSLRLHTQAAGALLNIIAVAPECKGEVGEIGGIEALVSLLQRSESEAVHEVLLRILRGLSLEANNRVRIVDLAGPEVLMAPTHTLHTHGRFAESVDLCVPKQDESLDND